jgi:two-component system response regulator RegA
MPFQPKPKLLLVDDDAVLCEVLTRGLAARGFDVRVAGTFAQAHCLIEESPYRYAIVDLRLPGGRGIDLVSMLKAVDAEARIVVLTGYGSVPTAVDAIKRGATYYLAKPASVDAIIGAFDHGEDRGTASLEVKPMSLPRLEWEHIQRVLQEHDGNISAAARALSMHRRTLQRKLAKHPARR